jgi:undecaprenyl-diphosphatase
VLEVRNLIVNGLPDGEASVFAAGILTSLVVGYVSIAFLLRFLVNHTTMIFIVYRVLFGIMILSLLVTGLR